MKMNWHADALAYKITGRAMTGLVYRHGQKGALPIGNYSMMNLKNVNIQEEEWYDATKFHFYPNRKQDMSCLTGEDIEILDMMVSKFQDFSIAEISFHFCLQKKLGHFKHININLLIFMISFSIVK